MSKQVSYLLYSKNEKSIIISRVCPVVYETGEQYAVDKGPLGLHIVCKEPSYTLVGEVVDKVNDYQDYMTLWCSRGMVEALVMLEKHLNKVEGYLNEDSSSL
jgi:hypothetical protein